MLRISGEGEGRRAGLAGLVSCGSPWACPTCAAKIGARRAEEIRQVIAGVDAIGGSAALVTLTLRHHRGHPLAESWSALRAGWARVVSGKTYVREREQYGVLGWCAAAEVTFGEEHGWHPHLHVLVLFDTPMSDQLVEDLAERWHTRFERALARRGYTSLADRGGLDARRVAMDGSGALGAYLSKVSHEVTGGSTKIGRGDNRSPWQLLRDGLATGNADDLERWWEWESASHGRKQISWSQGIRARFGAGPEQTDTEIAAEDLGSDDLIALPAETWRAVRDRAEELLTVAEVDGLPGALRWLDARRLAWHRCRGGSPPTECDARHDNDGV